MDNVNIPNIIEPHLNAYGYKSVQFSIKPKSYDFIELHADNSALLGCSNLTERVWNGSALVADDVEELKTVLADSRTNSKYISLPSGVTSGCFVGNSKKVLLAEDSGTISLWSKSESGEWPSVWSKDLETEEHDGAVLAMDSLADNQVYVTVGEDANIKVWDIGDFMCKKTFRYNQSAINDVSVCVDSTELFATAAGDGSVSLWSQHCDKRVKVLERGRCEARCVRWLDERSAVVGDEGGRLCLLDARSERGPVASVTLPFPLHRIAVQQSTKRIAVCGDAATVCVYVWESGATLRRLYAGGGHAAPARGLCWDPARPHTLHSVGWDQTVRTHALHDC